VCETARFVAELRGVSYAVLERDVEATAAALFGW
jgi:Tat protein secretion system quality control protein TatD with DNase activity